MKETVSGKPSLRTSAAALVEARAGSLTTHVLADLRWSGAQSVALRRLEVEAMLRWASTVRRVGHGWQWCAELDDAGDPGRLGRLIGELFGHSPSARLLDVPCRSRRWLLEVQGRAGGDLAERAGLVRHGRPVFGVAPRVISAAGTSPGHSSALLRGVLVVRGCSPSRRRRCGCRAGVWRRGMVAVPRSEAPRGHGAVPRHAGGPPR